MNFMNSRWNFEHTKTTGMIVKWLVIAALLMWGDPSIVEATADWIGRQ